MKGNLQRVSFFSCFNLRNDMLLMVSKEICFEIFAFCSNLKTMEYKVFFPNEDVDWLIWQFELNLQDTVKQWKKLVSSDCSMHLNCIKLRYLKDFKICHWEAFRSKNHFASQNIHVWGSCSIGCECGMRQAKMKALVTLMTGHTYYYITLFCAKMVCQWHLHVFRSSLPLISSTVLSTPC